MWLSRWHADRGDALLVRRVTRLIKAIKQQKPTRESILGGSPSGSSLSIPSPEVQVGQRCLLLEPSCKPKSHQEVFSEDTQRGERFSK